jgi:hypothetical protein
MKTTLLNIALFFAAPFIGLLYVILMPFVVLGIMLMLTLKSNESKSNDHLELVV